MYYYAYNEIHLTWSKGSRDKCMNTSSEFICALWEMNNICKTVFLSNSLCCCYFLFCSYSRTIITWWWTDELQCLAINSHQAHTHSNRLVSLRFLSFIQFIKVLFLLRTSLASFGICLVLHSIHSADLLRYFRFSRLVCVCVCACCCYIW